LVAIRFLFGVGEAGAYPNLTRALHNWFPYGSRAFAQGAMWMSGRLMGGLTALIWGLVVHVLLGAWPKDGWRGAFYLFGALGIAWCIAWAYWFRNRPEEKPQVNAAERALIRGDRRDMAAGHAHVPWKRLLTSGNLWALCAMYFCGAYGWYFNITLLPTYLETQHGVERESWLGAIYKGGPLGCMNTIGNLGGAVTILVTGFILDYKLEAFAAAKGVTVHALSASEKAEGLLPGYQINFLLYALVYVVAVFLWLRVDATKPVVPEAVEPDKDRLAAAIEPEPPA
jgi:MFS family permease